MSDKDSIPVNDRRRFDRDGNPRPAPQQAASDERAPAQDASAQAEVPPRPEDVTDVEAEGAAPAVPERDPEVVRLEGELESTRKRVDELARAYQALNKDREDFKQRLNRERERMLDVERGKVAVTLLEAIDELDRALSATKADDPSPLAQGVRLIRGNLLKKVESTGIERLDLVGKPYDPNLAEAVDMEMVTDEADDQKVLAEISAGYKLNDRVIRAARVKVAKYVQPAQA